MAGSSVPCGVDPSALLPDVARCNIQADIGFGDAVTPAPDETNSVDRGSTASRQWEPRVWDSVSVMMAVLNSLEYV